MADYCEHCDLPLSTCVHGMPPAPPPPVKVAPVRRKAAPAARASRAASAAGGTTAAPPRAVARKFTSPETLRPHIIAILEDAGGSVPADEVYDHLEARISDSLLAGDHQTTPEGELRWRYAARRARQGLITDGVLAAGPGLWRLAPA